MEKITLSFDTLMRQAAGTSQFYLREAMQDIDNLFGEGYASKNPGLVGNMVMASAIDYHGAALSKTMQDSLTELSDSIDGLSVEQGD